MLGKPNPIEVLHLLVIGPVVDDLREHPLDSSLWLTASIYFAVAFGAGAPVWKALLIAAIIFTVMSWGYVRKLFTCIAAVLLIGSMLVWSKVLAIPQGWTGPVVDDGSSPASIYMIGSFLAGVFVTVTFPRFRARRRTRETSRVPGGTEDRPTSSIVFQEQPNLFRDQDAMPARSVAGLLRLKSARALLFRQLADLAIRTQVEFNRRSRTAARRAAIPTPIRRSGISRKR